MKKLSLLILTSFISALLFNVSTAFAAPDDKKLKVYYSESIGAGQKVYHIVTCSKAPAWAPLKCIAKSETEAYFEPGQCKKEGKSLDGEHVKGCLEGDGQYMNVGDATYPLITEEGKQKYLQTAPAGCSDKTEQQGFVYAPELAVVDKSGATDDPTDSTKWKVLGKIVWPLGQTPDTNYLREKFGKDGLSAERTFRPALCVTYDVIAEGEGAGNREAVGELTGRVQTLFNDVEPIGQELIDAGCNNDNSAQSTIFDSAATASCAIQERITGDSGSDVLANYIGAIYRWAAGIVGIVAVLIMVASGIQISAAGGDSAKLDSAKNRILQSIIGLVVLFLSGLILYTINPTFFTGG